MHVRKERHEIGNNVVLGTVVPLKSSNNFFIYKYFTIISRIENFE